MAAEIGLSEVYMEIWTWNKKDIF